MNGAVLSANQVTIMAADGYPLGARVWTKSDAVYSTVACVNAGAGINSRFYDKFAQFLAEAGVPTVIYDYRGIGRSRHGTLRGFETSVFEWGSKDCAAVLAWLAATYPGSKRLLVGHSVGGFLTGFAANGHLIDEMLLVGAHTGYWGDYATSARAGMFVLWHLVMPAVTHLCGFFPGRSLHLLEDLPAGVAFQWAARRKPDFWWNLRRPDGSPNDELVAELRGRFLAVRAKTLAIRFSDDPFATAAATNRVLDLFANCEKTCLELGPADVHGDFIGHFGFFRSRSRSSLWTRVTQWLGT